MSVNYSQMAVVIATPRVRIMMADIRVCVNKGLLVTERAIVKESTLVLQTHALQMPTAL